MAIGTPTLIVVSALSLALFVFLLGPLVLVYLAAFAGLALMFGVMAHSSFVAVRNWQLDKFPGLHAPRFRTHRKPEEIVRRAA